jgi:hypothetical protein
VKSFGRTESRGEYAGNRHNVRREIVSGVFDRILDFPGIRKGNGSGSTGGFWFAFRGGLRFVLRAKRESARKKREEEGGADEN